MTTYDELLAPLASVPLSGAQLDALAHLCRLHSGSRVLDLACGNGDLLNRWAKTLDLRGTGVDSDAHAVRRAQTRADALEVWSNVQYVVAEPADYPQPFHEYNVVSGLGLGDEIALAETLSIMGDALRDPQSLILLGKTLWQTMPAPDVCKLWNVQPDDLPTLGQLTAQFDAYQHDLIGLLVLTQQDWDAYYMQQWQAVLQWTNDQHASDVVEAVLADWRITQQHYFAFERDHVTWGAFVLRPR